MPQQVSALFIDPATGLAYRVQNEILIPVSVGSGATGTVTNTAGALVANQLVVGNGGADVKTLANPAGLTPASYTSANITVDALGRVTAAANGSGGGLTPIAANSLLGNATAASAVPVGTTVSAMLDAALGSTQGQLITRNSGGWTVLGPSTGGYVLRSNGAGANLGYYGGVTVLTSGTTVNWDASLTPSYRLVLGANATLANPTNPIDGSTIAIRIHQDATGGRTLAYGTAYKWPGGIVPILSTVALARDLLVLQYDATDGTWEGNLLRAYA